MAQDFSWLGRVRPAALAALAAEIAKLEAVTVHKGGQTGNQNAAKDKDKTNVRNTDNRSYTRDKESVTGLLRRLAKQGRDDLLDRIAKLEAQTVKPGAPQGNQNAVKGDKTIRGNDTDCLDRNDRNQQSGLLRRLAKQGRDDLLDRVASGELRKDFTPTERVAIAKAIEEEIGNRQGKRTDLELRVVRPEVKDKRPREVAAEKAGFGSVVAVVENHTPKSGMKFAVELNSVH